MSARRGNVILIILGIIAMVSAIGIYSLGQLKNLARQRNVADLLLDAEFIRSVVRENVSCQKTLDPAATGTTPPPNCALATFDLKDHNGNILTEIGGWNLRGSCEANELKIEAELPDGAGGYVNHPISGLPMNYAHAPKNMNQTIAGSIRGAGSRLCRTSTASNLLLYRVTRKSFCHDPDTDVFTTNPTNATTGLELFSCVYEFPQSPATWDCGVFPGSYWSNAICSNAALYNAHPVIQKACTSFGGTLKPGCSRICGNRPGFPQVQGITCPDLFVVTPVGRIAPYP